MSVQPLSKYEKPLLRLLLVLSCALILVLLVQLNRQRQVNDQLEALQEQYELECFGAAGHLAAILDRGKWDAVTIDALARFDAAAQSSSYGAWKSLSESLIDLEQEDVFNALTPQERSQVVAYLRQLDRGQTLPTSEEVLELQTVILFAKS